MDFEPIRSSAVSGTAFGHADQEAFAKSARLAGRTVLLVNDAFAVVLAFGYGAEVVVGASEERLKKKRKMR